MVPPSRWCIIPHSTRKYEISDALVSNKKGIVMEITLLFKKVYLDITLYS